ncbi:MAG TPA: GH-E family nuclease [Pyrinomonadaceae bacterium]|jgi:uncharacterized Zn-binding protein involved in type VI secretion
MPEAARIGDTITHTKKLGGFLKGALLGAAVGAFVVATGGAGAVLIAGAALTGLALGSQIGAVVGGKKKVPKGNIITGASTVFINGRQAARACIDTALCDDHAVKKIAMGSASVGIESGAAARIGDKGECGFEIGEGSTTVIIGGGQGMCPGLSVDDEVPPWMRTAAEAAGILGAILTLGGGAAVMSAQGVSRAVIATRLGATLAGGTLGGIGGRYAGGKIFGEGSLGQLLMELGGSAAGGRAGGRAATLGGRGAALPAAPARGPARALTAAQKKLYSRPSGYRNGIRDRAWENAKGPDGNVRDPHTNRIMDKNEPWDMGHRPGYEFRKHQQSAAERGIDRKTFLDEHNNPSHYRPELPASNRSHVGEDLTDTYLGP